MGVKGLLKFLRDKTPAAFQQSVDLSRYAGTRTAVDVSGLLFKFKILNPHRWLDSFGYLVLSLKRNQLHPIFVFDGAAPPEKDLEKKERSEQRQKMRDRIHDFEQALDTLTNTGEVLDILREEMKKTSPAKIGETIPINKFVLQSRLTKLKSYIAEFDGDEINKLSKMFEAAGVQYIVAPGEAEAFCASLYHSKHVDSIITNDSDALAYGVETVLFDINGLQSTCTEVKLSQVLSGLKLESNQFLDFCIMCGTDYNNNIPKVGPVTALTLIRASKSIDALPNKYDVSILNHVRVRELFLTRWPYEGEVLLHQKFNPIDLANFFILNGCHIKAETVHKACAKPEIVFVE